MEPALQLGHLLLAPDERRGHRRARQHPAGGEDDGSPEVLVAELGPVPAERFRDVPGALRPLLGVLREALEDGGLQLLAHVRAEGPERLRQLVDDPVEDGLDLSRERRLSGEALVEDRAERVDVRPAVERPGGDLLRAEVRDRSDERSRLRQAVLARRERQAEVHHAGPDVARFVARRHDVLGLDVPVDDAAGVAVVERLGDLRPDVEDVAQPERALAKELPEVRRRQHGHHEEERPLVPAEVVNRHDGRVVHLRHDLGLALEALLGVLREVSGRNELDGDVPVQDRVLRAVDDAHPAPAQFGEDFVPIREPGSDQDFVLICLRRRPRLCLNSAATGSEGPDPQSSSSGRLSPFGFFTSSFVVAVFPAAAISTV